MAPKKNHSSARTTSEWVLWAKAEGFEDIEEHCGGVTQPGKVWFFCMGNQDVVVSLYQVYCTLCCVWISTTANSIKQHCVEYQVGSGETRKMVQSKHAQKVAKREERRKSIMPETSPAVNPVINITVAAPTPAIERVFACLIGVLRCHATFFSS